ncbi:hypothetical protein B0J11DRAFT_446498 [Dendryphion nanum]|uniref:ABM domain-containing protein n=1 Tax=Dendryphion nanum TaxID=256645 RepID=A0A9P9D5A0_9PLEO|nr:hypothetical protein B0J11DRAFT_446498 [Dendryphion nanum]
MPFTTVIVHPLVEGADINDSTNRAHVALRTFFDKIKQEDGFLGYFVGMQVQNPNILEAVINWEDSSKYNLWKASPEYGSVNKELSSIFTSEGEVYEAALTLEPHGESLKVFAAPLTEIVRFYFEGEAPSTYLDDFKKAGDKLREDGVQGVVAVAGGITHEEHEHNGVKGKVATVVVGWESLEHHMEFLKSETMQETSVLLRSTSKAIKFHHVKFSLVG